ncbi:MAG: fused MFS/spermidine synthase [Rhodocyclales bacterium]|nr:fused MFS/spermidine synthase [Rhodocyclales bacterium]
MSEDVAGAGVRGELLELPSPYSIVPGIFKLIEKGECADPDTLLERIVSGNYDRPFVVDDGTSRALHFSLVYIQSEMLVARPFELALAYTRKMMGFLLFVAQPRNVLLLGLGGGSLAKYCHRHLPLARITVVEISPDVIAFRDEFHVPRDDSRFKVVCADAADYIHACGEQFDVILTDAFDRCGFAESVSAPRFYASACQRLSPNGMLVANLAGSKDERVAHLGMIHETFGDNILAVPVADEANQVVFSFRNRDFQPRWPQVGSQAQSMRSRFGIDFPYIASRMELSRKLRYLERCLGGECGKASAAAGLRKKRDSRR